jgi:hypothetical protein
MRGVRVLANFDLLEVYEFGLIENGLEAALVGAKRVVA